MELQSCKCSSAWISYQVVSCGQDLPPETVSRILLVLSLLLCILHVLQWHSFKVRRWKQCNVSSNCQFKHSLAKHNLIPFHLYPGKIIFSCVLYMTLNWRSVVLLSVFVLFVDVGSDHIYQIEPLQVWDGVSLPVHHLWAWVTSRLLDNFSLLNFNFQFLHTLYWSASFKTIINFIAFYNSCKIGLIFFPPILTSFFFRVCLN